MKQTPLMKQKLTALSVIFSLLLGISLSLSGCRTGNEPGNQTNSQQTSKTITIGTFSKALGNSPYHIAKHFKWFEEEPALKDVKLNYMEYNDRPAISDAFSKGDLQVLYSAEVPSILIRAQGDNTRIVAVSANVAQNILVRSDLPYKTITDLRGKSIAVQQGTSSHYCLLKILKAFNMKESDVDLRYMPAAEGKVAFETNQLDAWAVWAPFVEQQEVSGKGRVLEGGDALINSVMTMSEPFMKDNESAARAVVSVIQRAKKWIVENPDEAQKIMADELKLDLPVVKKAWAKHNWAAQLDEKIINDIQEKATFLAESDKTRSGKNLDVRTELVDLRFAAPKSMPATAGR